MVQSQVSNINPLMKEGDRMDYMLMHKDIPVAELSLQDDTSVITKIKSVITAQHLPVGISFKAGNADRAALNEWWLGRSIPASRQGIKAVLDGLDVFSPQSLLSKNFGLSLSDQYWICPASSPLSWQNVNFFTNDFSEDMGNILFGEGTDFDNISLMSPDNTSDGWLKKRWTIVDGKRCLVKGGSGATSQEPYNEVLASAVMRRLGIPHIPYTLIVQDEYPYSLCEDFVTPETELISAWYIMKTQKKENNISVHQHYLNCCEALGLGGIQRAVDQMIVLDYLIVNEDRHQNNFGVIRNADTLEWVGAAPIFDSGSSLWFTTPTALIRPTAPRASCKPFKTSHDEQIKLVSSFDWLDLSALHGIEDEFRDILKDSAFIDDVRCQTITDSLLGRVDMLNEIRHSFQQRLEIPNLEHEVQQDTRYSNIEFIEKQHDGQQLDMDFK